MICRAVFSCLLSIIIGTLLLSCSGNYTLTSIQVTPATATSSLGTTVQFTATGTYTHGSHPPKTETITNSVTWTSSSPAVATVNSSGLATPVSAGTTNITATTSSSFGPVTGTATLAVSSTSSSGLISLTIIPGLGIQTVASLGETAQFLAIGTFSTSPTTVDLTDSVTWLSSDVDVATINSTGLATATGCESTSCTTTITASTTSGLGGADIVGTSSLTFSPGTAGPLLRVQSIGSGMGTIVSVPAGINGNCQGGCTAAFPANSSVQLTATPSAGSTFGGWTANCQPSTAPTCSVIVDGAINVAAIFNN
jgi:hypothetical protein